MSNALPALCPRNILAANLVMSGINGKSVSEKHQEIRPGIRVMISKYTADKQVNRRIREANRQSSGVVPHARTSTIVPLKTSSAFWMSGSFLKSSLLNGTGADGFSLAVGAIGFAADALAVFGVVTGAAVGTTVGASRVRPAGASALMNLICEFECPSSASLVWMMA